MNLDEFLSAYAVDDNAWWRLDSGEHQSLFDALVDRVEQMTMALAYYKAGATQTRSPFQKPEYVPRRVRLTRPVRGDFPGSTTVASAGDYDALVNQYGAVSVIADDGDKMGVRLSEFEALGWIRNPHHT